MEITFQRLASLLRPLISSLLSGSMYPCGGYDIILPLKMRLFIDLTPFTLPRRAYPPLLPKERGERFKRGASPLSYLHSPFPY